MATGETPHITEPPKPPRKRKPPFKKRLSARAQNLILEGIGTAIAVCIIAATDCLVSWLIGERKFFDLIPDRWVFDAAHIVVVGRLIWGVLRKFNEDDDE
jgi:hypothetical protein